MKTTADLIAALQKYPPDSPVFLRRREPDEPGLNDGIGFITEEITEVYTLPDPKWVQRIGQLPVFISGD